MKPTRRHFLASSVAAAAATRLPLPALGQQGNTIPPPTIITGGIRPLLHENTARPLRYHPDGQDFVILNGGEFFNRPIYGPISDFRVDAGDRPEFSLYLPGHGGNLKLGIITPTAARWLADCDHVLARYRPGRMLYEIGDRSLRAGTLTLELLTAPTGNGLLLKVEGRNLPPGTLLTWAFAGASGRKGRRNGDIGCEVEPVSKFFQVRSEECASNSFTLPDIAPLSQAQLESPAGSFRFSFPDNSRLTTQDFAAWSTPPSGRSPTQSSLNPILTGSVPIGPGAPLFLSLQQVRANEKIAIPADAAATFAERSDRVARIAAATSIDTPDPYINAAIPALNTVADALWDEKQSCVMHGCVAWRVALAGWRGPYVLDATGAHDRAKIHFRHWLARQNTQPVTTSEPATGPADPGMRLARKENLLHSNGDLSNNHYDMNLVFIDVLLRHLRWTGDLAFAREIWPAFERHLAWERRNFRRTFADSNPGSPSRRSSNPEDQNLPLYEAYAAIWASDNLQYSGGGTAHASAYNIFALRVATQLATLLGADGRWYAHEAEATRQAMQHLLWLPQQGAFAEAKDLMGPQTVYSNPAAWTVYHTLDSEVPTPLEAWQMVAERLAAFKRIPVHGPGVPVGDWFLLPCSDWLPYMWSLTLVHLSENMHFALAMWQAGMADEAFRLFKGNLLDSMYMGLCPGDIHMTSALDGHRQEAQRDFGDPAGCLSRALVEGLFGVQPDLLTGRITVRPGFPSDWTHASFTHADFDLKWRRSGLVETLAFTSRFPKQVPIELSLAAATTSLPAVTCNGQTLPATFDADAVNHPRLLITLPAATAYTVAIKWRGVAPMQSPATHDLPPGTVLPLPAGVQSAQLEDPQSALSHGRTAAAGFHTVFANIHQADARWSMPISFRVKFAPILPVPHLAAGMHAEPIDLTAHFTHPISQLFERSYAEPRSPLCTLSVPDNLLGGWANIDPNFAIDDRGLRAAKGLLTTPLGVPFRTPMTGPNAILLSYFHPDQTAVTTPLNGRATGLYLLVTGSTLPQASRMQNALATVHYTDGTIATLSLRNPETWWPAEQDYLLDDYTFVDEAPLPPRLNLRTGETRLLTYDSFKGKGRTVPGGAATILHLPLDPTRELTSLTFEVSLYNIVAGLLAATLTRPG